MNKKNFKVLDLLEMDLKKNRLGLRCIAGKLGLDNIIESKIINRPGLALGGYFNYFADNRIQVFGLGEAMFVKNARYEDEFKNVRELLKYDIPCCIFANNNMPSELFLELSNERRIPILISELSSSELVDKLYEVLGDVFAVVDKVHGVLVEVYGVGIMIKGKSGIGKSETALELLERGHRLVADDLIELKRIKHDTVIGSGTNVIRHHMEIRGIGIVNVKELFGVGGIRNEKKVQLVVELEEWDTTKRYERIGAEEKYIDVVGTKIPYLIIPVKPGRNIPIIIETAAMDQRLKIMGVNSAKEFNRELLEHLEREKILNNYFSTD